VRSCVMAFFYPCLDIRHFPAQRNMRSSLFFVKAQRTAEALGALGKGVTSQTRRDGR
jgi:hypothetical protein